MSEIKYVTTTPKQITFRAYAKDDKGREMFDLRKTAVELAKELLAHGCVTSIAKRPIARDGWDMAVWCIPLQKQEGLP